MSCILTFLENVRYKCYWTDLDTLRVFSGALRRLPTKVLWKLSKAEVPDEDALQSLGLAPHVKVRGPRISLPLRVALCEALEGCTAPCRCASML